jgi:hypothetical protein
MPPPSPGLSVFARRKRSVFKGPGGLALSLPGLGAVAPSGVRGERGSRSGSVQGRRSGEVIEEEDEELCELEEVLGEEDEVEEVEEFSPVKADEVVEMMMEEKAAAVGATAVR